MELQQILHPNRPKMGIGFFFLSVGAIITLITSVVSFLNLVFATLDKKFPDVLNATYQYGYTTADYESIRSSLATLIIFFPIFLVVSFFWNKEYKKGVGHIDEIIRKWILYVIIFLSSLVIAIDLVILVRYFVSGEITNRFIYKVLVAFIVALFIGAYYILQLKGKKKLFKVSVNWGAGVKAFIFVGLAVYFAFCVMGSPFTQRKLQFDEKRISDLQSIQWQIVNYYQQKEKLPETLEALKDPISGYALPVDPEFEKGINYEYAVIDAKALKFKLCATFALPIPKGWREYNNAGVLPLAKEVAVDGATTSYPYPGPSGIGESWKHEAGHTCFERTIDKEIYKPYSKLNQ